jgi:superfamily I DNA and/or RNA helicase
MEKLHPQQEKLLQAIDFELKEQEKRYALDSFSSLKQLKSLGMAIHPISITRKSFGYADYPEISFKTLFFSETSSFRDNSAIELFLEGEQSIRGILLNLDGQKGEIRLFAPDFPDWVEEKGIGIKLSPDQHTFDRMKEGVKNLNSNKSLYTLFQQVHSTENFGEKLDSKIKLEFQNPTLNESQKNAVKAIVENESLKIIHGPPGTGKTTTLIEAIHQLIIKGEKVVVAAPSNAAVDNIAKGLLNIGVKILRIGNVNKVDEAILANTLEGKMQDSKESKEIKRLKIRAEELRKMATQYKRNFGREEGIQRNLLLKEVKNIRSEIRKLRSYFNEIQFEQSDVILGTPIAIHDQLNEKLHFDTLVIDEAGQTLEPLAWLIFSKAEKWVLAGDPFQLPPTVLSKEADKLGFSKSILEQVIQHYQEIYFLNTQYRMRKSIADFSSSYFYKNELLTPEGQNDIGQHFLFIDTAGTGFEEEVGEDGYSLMNHGELTLVNNFLNTEEIETENITFISPYSAQIELARKSLERKVKIKTIDSFQGQENQCIIISLVRSNADSNIGFLSDYRRMNVALTRAKEKLILIGDSATIGQDSFYAKLLNYIESIDAYHSAWEYMNQ